MAIYYINAGLQLFKQSQLAIFDKALSLVELFDTAVTDSVNVMQGVYPNSEYYETQRIYDAWQMLKVFLEGNFRQILVCFLFTVGVLCSTIFIIRHRRKSCFLEQVIKKANETRFTAKPLDGNCSLMSGANSSSLSDRNKLEKDRDVRKKSPVHVSNEQGDGDRKLKATLKKSQDIHRIYSSVFNSDKKFDRHKVRKKRSGSRSHSRGSSVERKSTITDAISSILSKKLTSPKLKRRPDKPQQTGQFPRLVKPKEKFSAQEKAAGTNRAQVFILLSGMERDNSKKKQQTTQRKRLKSPKKANTKKAIIPSSPKRQSDPIMTRKNLPSLKQKKVFKRGQLSSPLIFHQKETNRDDLISVRQKQIANIPYLHTLPPKRPNSLKAGPRSCRHSEEKGGAVYFSSNSRMVSKDKNETKRRCYTSKGVLWPPNKRCKTCKKIRQRPDTQKQTELFQRAKDDIGNLFCFSPDAILPAPFQNVRIRTDLNSLSQAHLKNSSDLSNVSRGEDTNMNKAILKLDLQNDNSNIHKMEGSCFATGENFFLSTTSTRNERLNNFRENATHSAQYPKCIPCKIQRNANPFELNGPHVNGIIRMNPTSSEDYINQNESMQHKEGNPVPQTHQHIQQDGLNSVCSDNQLAGAHTVPRNQFVGYNGNEAGKNCVHKQPNMRISGKHYSHIEEYNNLFQPNHPSRLESINEQKPDYLSSLSSKYHVNRCRNHRKNLYRDSRKRCLCKNHSSKHCQTFCSQDSLPKENLNSSLSDRKLMAEIQSEAKLKCGALHMNGSKPFSTIRSKAFDVVDYKSSGPINCRTFDTGTDDMPTRRCDKMKSHRWRHRHEPYKFSPSIINMSVSQSKEDFSNATYTIQPSSLKPDETDSDSGLYQPGPKFTDLAALAHFTASTDTSNDMSTSSGIDPCIFRVQSFQNKNNCSPSRLAKPFIKPVVNEVPHEITAMPHSTDAIKNSQEIESSQRFDGILKSPKFSHDWQISGGESEQAKNNSTTLSVEESDMWPSEPGKKNMKYSPRKDLEAEIMQRDVCHPITHFLSPNRHELRSFQDTKSAIMFSSNRPRNKLLYRQNSMFKYPLLARKNILKAIGRHVPKHSSPAKCDSHNHSTSLGVQTSCASLRHTAVQTSPIEEQTTCRLRPGKFHPKHRPPNRTVEQLSKDNHMEGGWLNKACVGNSTNQSCFNEMFVSNKHPVDRKCFLNNEDVAAGALTKDGIPFNLAHSNKKADTDTELQDTLIDSERRSSTIKSDGTDTDNERKTHPFPVRRKSLPILSMSSSTCDVNCDGIMSVSRDSTPPSTDVLDSTSKDWLARPKWENANVDEVNRRVERALRLRQELQQYRSGKTSVCSQEISKPSSLFNVERQGTDGFSSTSRFMHESKEGVKPKTIDNSTETKYTILSIPTTSTTDDTMDVAAENDIQSSTTIITVRKAESEATDTLVKTLSLNAHPTESFVSENAWTGDRKEAIRYGDSATETEYTSDTPERSSSHNEEAIRIIPNSTEMKASSATSPSRNAHDDSWADEAQGNVPRQTQSHRNPTTKNSPPIKISKMENVIQTEYPKLVGELVHALPHVPLASFVEWFIETSNPGQFISSDESTSTTADAKEVAANAAKEEVRTGGALRYTENDKLGIYGRQSQHDDAKRKDDPRQNNPNSSNLLAPTDILNASGSKEPSRNKDVFNIERVLDNTTKNDDSEGRVSSIRRILLARKDSEKESSDITATTTTTTTSTTSKRRIHTLRQTSSSSIFEGNDS